MSGQSAGETLDTLHQSSLLDNKIVQVPLLMSCSAKVPRSVTPKCHDSSVAMISRKAETYSPDTHVIDLAELRLIIFEMQQDGGQEAG